MIRILFVCHGNICRSPMAEFILKDMVKNRGMENDFYIASAATSTEEILNGTGNPVYPPAQAELKKHGISCGNKRAALLKRSDYDKYDYIIGMDDRNMHNISRIIGGDRDKKVYKLLGFAGSQDDISDPWYSGDFKTAYNDIERGCTGLLEKLSV